MIVTNAHMLRDALDGHAKGGLPIMVSLQDERVFEARVLSCDRWGSFRADFLALHVGVPLTAMLAAPPQKLLFFECFFTCCLFAGFQIWLY
jgi:hypothetical protein